MFKRRQQDYRRGLVERAQPHLAGETVRVFALAQGVDPRLQLGAIVVAVVVVNGSLIGSENYLPTWMGIVGIALVVMAQIGAFFVPRRFILRTDEHVYLFAVPRRRRHDVRPPLAKAEVVGLPTVLHEERRREFGGERLWPVGGARSGDREALAQALVPAQPSR